MLTSTNTSTDLDLSFGGVACTVRNEDAGRHMSQCASACRGVKGHMSLTISDLEHALGILTRAILDRRGHRTILEFSPVAKHETDEATERTSQAAARQAGALGLSFEARFQEAVRDLRLKPGSQHSWSHQGNQGT